MIDQVLGNYRIVSLLGSGANGEVWLADHTVLGRRVAVKVLHAGVSQREDIVERFFDEARAATKIADPGIAHVYDFGWHDGAAYLVMEHLDGETLAARLARERTIPVPHALRLARYVALTMSVAHAAGIVHRDLKPDNLFAVSDPALAGGERLKILDFGIAKLLGGDDAASGRTESGMILGTPMYMSPEQCRAASAVDLRTDIYALGCVLYHALCGRPPFMGAASGELIASHLMDEPAPPSTYAQVAPAVDALVLRCLAKVPDDRFATMTDLALAIGDVLDADGAGFAPTTAPRPRVSGGPPAVNVGFLPTLAGPPPVRRRRRLLVVLTLAIAAGALVMAAGSWLAFRGTHAGRAASPPDANVADANAPPTDASPDASPDATTSSIGSAPPVPIDAPSLDAPRPRLPADAHPKFRDPYEDP